MLARMLQRRGTAAQWEDVKNTVILAPGEIGLETDTGKFKVGDGITVWDALSYYLRDSDNDDIYSKLTATQTFTGTQTLSPANATSIPLEVRGVDAQSAKLQRWRVGIGAPVEVASMDASGMLTANGADFNNDVDLNGNVITGVGLPVDPSDATNKQYVDDAIAGLAWKEAVHLIAHGAGANVALTGNTGTLVIDGHPALVQADSGLYRILLTAQTTASQNGIYLYTDNGTTYTLTRTTDADVPSELHGASVYVQEGTLYGTSSWVQSNYEMTTFAQQTWVQFSGAALITAGNGLTKDGNKIDVVAGDGLETTIDSVKIASGGVTSAMIANGTIVNEDVSSTAAIAATKISGTAVTQADTGTVATGMIANDAITNDKIANNAVGLENMQDDSVGTSELVDGSVTSAKIANGTIVDADVNASAAIAQSKIANLVTDLSNKSDITHTHTLDNLSDVVISTPSDRQVLKYKGAPLNTWVNELPSGGISIGATPPVDAAAGDAWFDSTDGSLYVYYDDGVDNDGAGPGTSRQWVQVKANSALEGSILTRLSAVESRNTQLEGANAVRVSSMAQRDSVFPAPVQGNAVFRADLGYEEKYYAAFNATTNPDGTTGTPGWYRYAGGAPLSQNMIINSAFDIWQRGTSFTNLANEACSADRWKTNYDGTGATRVWSQQALAPGTIPTNNVEGSFFLRFNQSVAGTGGTYNNPFKHAIEDVRTFAGDTVTLSFWAKADATRTLTPNFAQNFGTGGSSVVFVVGTAINLTTSWQRYQQTFNIPSVSGKTIGANNHLELFIGATTNTVQTLDIWGVQLEVGPVATDYRRNQPNIQAELAACQRYFQPLIPGSSDVNVVVLRESTTQAVMPLKPLVQMRIAPTLFNTGGAVTTGTAIGRIVCRDTAFGVSAQTANYSSIYSPTEYNLYIVFSHTAIAGTFVYSEFDTLTGGTSQLFLSAEL